MADITAMKNVLSVIATSRERVRELVIKDSQLIFVQDANRIAFDFKGKREFYNNTTVLDTEAERLNLDTPLPGYYFVIDRAVLWLYQNDVWYQITGEPQDVLFVGVELPELGQANKIYANTTSGSENISVWDEELNAYVIVADKTQSMTPEDVIALFNR